MTNSEINTSPKLFDKISHLDAFTKKRICHIPAEIRPFNSVKSPVSVGKIQFLAKKFVIKLKEKTRIKKKIRKSEKSRFLHKPLKLLKDLTVFMEIDPEEQEALIPRILSFFKLKLKIPISDGFLIKWKIMKLMIYWLNFLIIPIDIAFLDVLSPIHYWIKGFFFLFFPFDYFIKYNDKSMISHLTSYDFLIFLAILLDICNNNVFSLDIMKYSLDFVIFLMTPVLIQKTLDFQRNFLFSFKSRLLCFFVNFNVLIIFSAHFWTCFWTFIENKEDNGCMNWLELNKLDKSTLLLQYFYRFYYCFETITFQTTTFVVKPIEISEIFVFFAIKLYSMLFLSFFLYEISCFLLKNREFQENSIAIHRLLREKTIDPKLQGPISDFLNKNNENQEKIRLFQQQKSLLSQLPLEFQAAIQTQNGDINKIGFFKVNFLPQTIDKIKTFSEELIYASGQQIIEKSAIDESLFLIIKGQVIVCFSNNLNSALYEKKQGELFNEIEFLIGNENRTSVFAKSLCVLMKIERKKVIEMLRKESLAEYFKFCHLKDSILVYSKYADCIVCGNRFHDEFICPKIHYVSKTKEFKVKMKSFIGLIQQRSIFNRNSPKRRMFKEKKLCCNNTTLNEESEIFTYSRASMTSEEREILETFTIDVVHLIETDYFPHNHCGRLVWELNKKKIEKVFFCGNGDNFHTVENLENKRFWN